MKKHLITLIGVSVALLLVAGCGKKGGLEAPAASTSASETPEVDETVQPMDNPSVTPKWPGAATPNASGSGTAY